MRKSISLVCGLSVMASCGPGGPFKAFLPKKTYSSDIGITGVPVAAGQLVGTWYAQLEFATIITLPLVGAQNAGANGGRLLNITWDAGRNTYVVQNHWCWDDVFEVQGTQNSFTNDQLHALRASNADLHVDEETGHVWMDQVVDLWGAQNLPDPANTPLPNKDTYQQQPQSDWMLDEDSDGHPGVTVHIAGNFNGEGYIVNRSVFTPDGVARSVDELVGLLNVSHVEQKLLDSTVRIAGQSAGDTDQVPDPDPKASWFQMVRGRDGATCDDVLAAKGNRLGRRPF